MGYSKLLAELRQIGELTVLRKKTHVSFQGEVPRYAYYLLDGAIKAYVITADGSQAIVDVYAKHSMLPVAWLNRSAKTSLFYYEALVDTRAIKFTRQDFEHALIRSPKMHEDYTQYLSDSQTALLFRATGLSQSSASHKVCYALYFLVYRYGIEQDRGDYVVPIPLTHELIASFIGQSRENTSKTIKNLSQEGILQYRSKTYTVNLNRLERYLGEDAFRDIVA